MEGFVQAESGSSGCVDGEYGALGIWSRRVGVLGIDNGPGGRKGMIRDQWMDERYAALRNAAWWVRNTRSPRDRRNLAVVLLAQEARRLCESGQGVEDVVVCLCELLK